MFFTNVISNIENSQSVSSMTRYKVLITLAAPKATRKMKKGLSILFASALLTGFVSCGMSEEERKADSAQQDSVIAETGNTTDSLIAMMERENAMMDSIAKADSAAAADSAAKAGK
jgi:hypothetical protein